MDEERVRELLIRYGVFLKGGHFVFGSGRHSDSYVDTDSLFVQPRIVSDLSRYIATRLFLGDVAVEAVAGSAVGGAIIAQEVARQHKDISGDDLLAVFGDTGHKGDTAEFVFGPSFRHAVRGKRVLVVDDVAATGRSARKVADAVRSAGGVVTHAAVLVNRGGVTPQDMGVEELISLLTVEFKSWTEKECPLCRREVPVNVGFGHGREFLAHRDANRI